MSDDSTAFNSAVILAYASVGLGLILVVTGIFSNQIIPSTVYWTEEDKQAFDEANNAAHAALSGHSHVPAGDDNAGGEVPDFETARAELDAMRAKLESARSQKNNLGTYLSIAGVVFLIAGAAVLRRSAA